LVTGGAGFIGSDYVRLVLASTEDSVVIVDNLTYAGNHATMRDFLSDPRVTFVESDIADPGRMTEVFSSAQPAWVVNFAAESHVDRSIDGPRNFLHSNTVGAFELLEVSRRYWAGLADGERDRFRFLHVSTDEVFGSLGPEGAFSETSPYAPRSPYSATKAGADHLVRAYRETFGLPTLITNCSNNYGPFQYPEKLIPLATQKALQGETIPVYGDGRNVRDWIFVRDHVEGILAVLSRGLPGSTYHLGARNERTNLDVVQAVCTALEELLPAAENPKFGGRRGRDASYHDLVTFVEDRPGHDYRYAIDPSRIEREIGWRARAPFEESLKETVRWYLENQEWCQEVVAGAYGGERLGLGRRQL
jgi:dTDP-glucose 4,6-dehydratase